MIVCVAAVAVLGWRLAGDARAPAAVIVIGLLDTGANLLFGTASTI